MYLIDRDPQANPHEQKFYVLGSVGNVYTVTISHIPSCTCPDHAKGNLCKHIVRSNPPFEDETALTEFYFFVAVCFLESSSRTFNFQSNISERIVN